MTATITSMQTTKQSPKADEAAAERAKVQPTLVATKFDGLMLPNASNTASTLACERNA